MKRIKSNYLYQVQFRWATVIIVDGIEFATESSKYCVRLSGLVKFINLEL
jgi:hypothetical protein